MELKTLAENFIEKFEIKEISELGEKLLDVCINNKNEIFQWYLDLIDGDLETDYLQKIFQYYEADRKDKKQDYTPKSLAKLVSELSKAENETVCLDMCCGSGALTIQKWVTNKNLKFVCMELDSKVLPFLMFNLIVRNIEAEIIHENVLSDEVFQIYKLTQDDKFSMIEKVDKSELEIDTCISNPPFNLKWQYPPLPQTQERFKYCDLPPESNANYAFVLSALERVREKACFILPNSVLSSGNKQEKNIIQYLINQGFFEMVVSCPKNMFESTDISTAVLVLNKNNSDKNVIKMVDARGIYQEEEREQRGQFGGNSHTKRVYKKTFNVFTDENIKQIQEEAIGIDVSEIKEQDCNLNPSRYIELAYEEPKTRSYEDIVNDLNRVIKQKNLCKLTINETLARGLGFDVDLYKNDNGGINESLKSLNLKVEKQNYISFTKNKNEFKFENASKEELSHILILILQQWKNHIYFLNNEENRYLVELRDKLLPDLMSGKLPVS